MKNKIGSSRAESRDPDSSTAVGMTLSKNPNIKRIISYILLLLFIGFGIWYAKNRQAQNIVSGVVSSPIDVLKNTIGVTNVLFLGIGGEGHEGSDLTDTMLLVSFNLVSNKLSLISLPRDIWVPSMKAKINTAYHYGGIDLSKSAVSETLGVPVHYAVRLDFQGFIKAIDAVGGIEIVVDRSFDDYKYPIPGKETVYPESDRYEHVRFEQGTIHMDGSTALKFARSRHAEGDEGTDYARSKRQEKIILSFRDKVISTGTLFNSATISKLKDSVVSSIDTDLNMKEQGSFAKVVLNLENKNNLSSISLTPYLVNPQNTKNYGGQWVLIPVPSLEALQSYVKTELAK